MMKSEFGFVALAAAGCLAFGAWAEEATVKQPAPADGEKVAKAIEEEKSDDGFLSRFSYGMELEADTAYVYHGAVLNDRPIASAYPWFDFDLVPDEWSIGATLWVLNDLTNRRRREGLRGEWNERDWELHTDYTIWQNDTENEDDQCKLTVQAGYYWEDYTVHGSWYNDDGTVDYRKRKDFPSVHYSFAKFKFENPYLTPFVNGYYEFVHLHSLIVEAGVEKSFGFDELTGKESLKDFSLDLSFTLDGGHKRFINNCYMTEDAKTGLAAAEARAGITWQAREYLSFNLYVAYTGLLNSRILDDHREQGSDLADWYDHDQFVYGGFMAAFEF